MKLLLILLTLTLSFTGCSTQTSISVKPSNVAAAKEGKESQKWKQAYDNASAELVVKASKAKLDSDSLSKIFKIILSSPENKGLALLPVSAISTIKDGDRIWKVNLAWEYASIHAGLGHVRSFSYSQKTLRQVGFTTCM